MSQENVEIARRWQAAMNAGPSEGLVAISQFWDPSADYYPVRKFPEARPRHGREDLAQFVSEFWDAYSESVFEIEVAIDIGGDRVLLCLNLRAEGHKSEVALEGKLYQCLWLRHGRFFRVEDHLTVKGALHALGLQAETFEEAGLQN